MQRTLLVLLGLPTLINATALAQAPTAFQPPPASAHCDLERYRARYPWPTAVDTLVMEDSLDVPLQHMVRGPFEYPTVQRAAGVQGWVVIGTLVDPTGHVVAAEVMASSDTAFEGSTLRMMRQSQYEPPRAGGRPVWTFWCQCITFRIPGL